MGAVAVRITGLTIVYSTVYSGTDQTKHQSSELLAFGRGIHRWPVNSPHKRPVTRKMFPFDDVTIAYCTWKCNSDERESNPSLQTRRQIWWPLCRRHRHEKAIVWSFVVLIMTNEQHVESTATSANRTTEFVIKINWNSIKCVRRPGVEPGSTAWKATMLTVTPPTLHIYTQPSTQCTLLCLSRTQHSIRMWSDGSHSRVRGDSAEVTGARNDRRAGNRLMWRGNSLEIHCFEKGKPIIRPMRSS